MSQDYQRQIQKFENMILANDQEVASLQKDITAMRRLKADFEERCNSM